MDTFGKYAEYYDAFYGDKDYSGEAKIIQKILGENQKKPVLSILNMGCGTGRHDFELRKLGYTVKGIDLSQEMISIAQQKSFLIPDGNKYLLKLLIYGVIEMKKNMMHVFLCFM